MAQTCSIEFKEEACKRVQSGIPAAQVARELGINVDIFYTWMPRFTEDPNELFDKNGSFHSGRCRAQSAEKAHT